MLLILPLLLLRRPLFSGEALFWGTPALQFVPWQRATAEMWRAGHLPLWNPLLGCGAPLAANYQTGAFYPLYGLALALPAEVALGWTVALHLALTGLGMYGWARAVGLDRFPALLAGLTLEGCGFLVARAGLFPSIVVTFPWLPIWLWRAERLSRTRRVRDGLWLGGALGMGLLAGHAQTAFYGLLLLGAYLAFRALRLRRGWHRGELLSWIGCVACALALGVGLAAVQLLPTAELLHLSQRATGVDRELGLTYSFWPWRLLTLIAPDLFGSPARGDYWGYGNYWEDAVYVGLLPLLLALEAVMGARRGRPWRRAVFFWSLVAGCSLFLALGRNNPVFLWLFEHVPTFDWFQAPARWLAVTSMALAALAGIGAQTWRRGRAARRRGVWGGLIGLAAALGGLVAARLPGIPASFGPATVRAGLTLAAAGGVAVWGGGGDYKGGDHKGGDHKGGDHKGGDHKGRPYGRWWWAVVGLVLIDLATFGWGLVPSVDRAFYAGRSDLGGALAADPAVERIFWPAEGQPEPGYEPKFRRFFRFDTFGPRDLGFWWSLRETLLPNLGMLDGVASANNFEPLRVGWYDEVTRAADDAPNLIRAMGVTHLVTATTEARVHVTAVPDALGRAWVVPTARVLPPDQILPALTSPSFDPAAEVLLAGHRTQATSNQQPATGNQQPATSNQQRATRLQDDPNRVTIRAVLDRPGYLVLADTWYPGWEAAVDGEPVPLLRANHAFRAVRLEAGEHVVEMVYRPLSVRVGGAISLIALAVLTVGLVWTGRRKARG